MEVKHTESLAFDHHFGLMLKQENKEMARDELLRVVDTLFTSAVALGVTKQIGIPKDFYLTKFQKDLIKILLKNGKMDYGQIKTEMQKLGYSIPTSRTIGGAFSGLSRKSDSFKIEHPLTWEFADSRGWICWINPLQKPVLEKDIDKIPVSG